MIRARLAQFALAALVAIGFLPSHARAQVGSFDIFMTRYFQQTSPLAPSAPWNLQFTLRTFDVSPATDFIATVSGPGGVYNMPYAFSQSAFVYDDFAFGPDFSAYPPGDYVFTRVDPLGIQPGDGGTLTLGAPFFSGVTPFFTNFAAAQSLLPSLPFTLQWNSFAGEANAAYLQDVLLIALAHGASVPAISQSFDDLSTASFEIAPGTLAVGQTYDVYLHFRNIQMFDQAYSNDAPGFIANSTVTFMTITPVPEPSQAALMLAGLGLAAWVARRRGARA